MGESTADGSKQNLEMGDFEELTSFGTGHRRSSKPFTLTR